MIYIENLTFKKEIDSINASIKEFKYQEIKLSKKQIKYFWSYLNNENIPILGNLFINDICYSQIDEKFIKMFNYDFLLLINDDIFYSKNLLVSQFLKSYINIFNKKNNNFIFNKKNNNFENILKKLNISNNLLGKKIIELTNFEKIIVFFIISLSIKRKITFIKTNYFDKETEEKLRFLEDELNELCLNNEILIIRLKEAKESYIEAKNEKLTIYSSFNIYEKKKINLFTEISKIITNMFKVPLIIFSSLFLIFFTTSLILSYSFGHKDIITHQFILTYLIFSLSIATLLFYLLWIFVFFFRYKGFINNIPILFRQKIMYLCIHFWIVVVFLTIISNIISLIVNFIIFGNIKLSFWNSNFYMSLGVLIISIILTPIWIIAFNYDDKIKKFIIKIRMIKNEK